MTKLVISDYRTGFLFASPDYDQSIDILDNSADDEYQVKNSLSSLHFHYCTDCTELKLMQDKCDVQNSPPISIRFEINHNVSQMTFKF